MDIKIHCQFAFLIRIALLFYGSFQDSFFDLKYTDIDYQVFTDAAVYLWNGESPFQRFTYRYTPLLAVLLTPNIFLWSEFGKLLFCTLDIVTCLLIYHIQMKCNYSLKSCKNSAFLWLYNPLTAVISTRGNSESIMTSLIMLSILSYLCNYTFLFGFLFGFSVHVKIYPCIYALTFYFMLSDLPNENIGGWKKFRILFYPNKKKVIFAISAAFGFLLPTIASVYFYGSEYINSALLYHLTRKDVRHNFSPYFYLLYLSETLDNKILSLISVAAFSLQGLLIFLVSWVFYLPKTLPTCLFVETFLFVTFNKVCTSQYFLWYLCLFPLCFPILDTGIKSIVGAAIIWFLGQCLWLLPAYFLEFRGHNTFILLFFANFVFFLINIYLISKFVKLIFKSFRPYITIPKNAKEKLS